MTNAAESPLFVGKDKPRRLNVNHPEFEAYVRGKVAEFVAWMPDPIDRASIAQGAIAACLALLELGEPVSEWDVKREIEQLAPAQAIAPGPLA